MSRLLASLLFTALAFVSSFGQVQGTPGKPPSPSATPSPAIDPAIEKKALDLIETLSEQVGRLHSPSNRMRAQVAVADLLWTRDEKRARALFTAALSQLTNEIAEIDYSDPEIYQEMNRITQSRQELILRIAAHDAELAIVALRQTRFSNDGATRMRSYNYQYEINLEMNVATLISAKNPAAALKLARASLSRGGVTWNLISFLHQLSQKDQKAGQSLYEEIVSKIKDEDLNRNTELANHGWHLLTSYQPPQANEEAFKELLTHMVNNLLTVNRQTQAGMNQAQNLYHQIERIVPMVEKYTPSRAAEMRDWSQLVERALDPSTRLYQEMNKISQNGTLDEILAFASKSSPDFQNMLYQQAAWKLSSSGDHARAKEIAEMIPDPAQRRQVLDHLHNQALNAAEGNNKISEARRLAERARNVNEKVEILTRAANTVAAEGDKTAALALLAEAKTSLAGSPQSSHQFYGQMSLARAYLSFDVEQSLVMLQPLIPKLNELVAAAAVLDGIDFPYLKNGEWVMPGQNNLGNIINTLDQTLALLGQKDFDNALKLADQIERPELRLLIEIDLALAALGVNSSNLRMLGSRSYSGRIVTH